MVLKLLTLNGRRTEESFSAVEKVAPCSEVLLVNEEILLLGTNRRDNAPCSLVSEQTDYAQSRRGNSVHRTEKGSFGIQSLAAVGAEGCGYVERAVTDKGVGRRVPGGVASRLKGSTQTARGERRGVGLAANKLLARKLHYYLTAAYGSEEGVMLLRRDTRQRLEPMSEMGRAMLNSPILHSTRYNVGNAGVNLGTCLNSLEQRFIYVFRESFPHYVLVKNAGGKYIGYTLYLFHFVTSQSAVFGFRHLYGDIIH